MNAATLLADLAAAGVHICREGDTLRVRGKPGVTLEPYREVIATSKPTLLVELRLREAIIAAVTVEPDAFDRPAYDALVREYEALQAQEIAP